MVLTVKPSFFSCGLVYGCSEHHLDHLAPLCSLLEIPLCVTEPAIKDLATLFYPYLLIDYIPPDRIASYLMSSYQQVITALPKDLFNAIFFLTDAVTEDPVQSIWCPHGNSDKGKRSFFAEALQKESSALVYGQTMLDFFSEKQALSKSCKTWKIGGYRYNYFNKHKIFYSKKIHAATKTLASNHKTLLYAPTWADSEGYSSVFAALETLLENRPAYFNLLIKLHPNTLLSDDVRIQKLLLKYQSSKHVLFIENFPCIYPLLDFVDIYLGDSSSIGYDMLYFGKPMLFINIKGQNFDLPLFSAGQVVYPQDIEDLYCFIERHLVQHQHYINIQKKLRDKTFAKKTDIVKLKLLLKNSLCPSPSCALYS